MLTLTPDELRELTMAKRHDAQSRVLGHMGIPHSQRPDGSLVVLRSVVERILGGALAPQGTIQGPEPELMP